MKKLIVFLCLVTSFVYSCDSQKGLEEISKIDPALKEIILPGGGMTGILEADYHKFENEDPKIVAWTLVGRALSGSDLSLDEKAVRKALQPLVDEQVKLYRMFLKRLKESKPENLGWAAKFDQKVIEIYQQMQEKQLSKST